MSLRVMPELIQGTEEWHDHRRGMVTASVVGKLITATTPDLVSETCSECKAPANAPCISRSRKTPTPIKTFHDARRAKVADLPPVLQVADNDESHGLTALLTAERITGFTDPVYVSADMWRGVEDEPRAVEVYSEHFAPVETVGFMVRDDWGFEIGYSPDGLVGDDGLIEVKSRRPKTQLLHVVSDEIPAANMAQLQCGLLVSGRKWIDYVSYSGGMHMWRKRVWPDHEWFAVIIAAVRNFEANSVEMVAAYNQATTDLPLTARPVELEMI